MKFNKIGAHHKGSLRLPVKVYEQRPIGQLSTLIGIVDNSWPLNDYERMLKVNIRIAISARLKKSPLVKVLDVGCGQGAAMNELAEILAKQGTTKEVKICGVDRVFQGKTHKFIYVVNDFETFDPKETFDIITANHVLRYFPHKLESIAKIYSLLSSGGEAHINILPGSIMIEEKGKTVAFEDSALFADFLRSGVASMEVIRANIRGVQSSSWFYILHLKKVDFIPNIIFPVKYKGMIGISRGNPTSVYIRP